MTDDRKEAVDQAAKGLTRAAQNYTNAEDFVAVLKLWTKDLDRMQLVNVVAQLAAQLSNFYGSDPLADNAEVIDADLRAWLDGTL